MPIIREADQGSINASLPQTYIIEREPASAVRAASTNVAGMVAQASRGDLDVIHEVGSMEEWVTKLGDFVDGLDGFMAAKNYFDANGGLLKVARAASTGTAVANVNVSGALATSASGTIFNIEYDSVGTDGNGTTVTVSAATVTGYVNIEIRKGKQFRSYEKVTSLATDTTNYIKTLIDQDSNRFFEITMVKTDGSLPVTGVYTMSGGSNGTTTGTSLDDSAYVGTDDSNGRRGLQLFKQDDEVIIVFSARSTDTINTALINHVNDLTLSPRRTIMSFALGTSIATAITNVASLDNDKVKVVYPYVKVRNVYTKVTETVSPVPFAVGLDTVLSYHISASQQKLPATVIGVERIFSNSELVQLTKGRVNPINNKKGRGFIYASDYTTSTNTAKTQNSTRKAKDFFAISFDASLQPYISKPITPELWETVRSAFEAFLDIESDQGRIGRSDGGTPYSVKIDSDNNPQAVVQSNRMIIEVQISLLGHADLILCYLDASIDKTIVNS